MRRLIPLHRNESYWLLEGVDLSAIGNDLPAISTYPSYAELTRRIGEHLSMPDSSITLTPGSDAAIDAIAQMCKERDLTALLPLPTFYGYERILTNRGVRTRHVYARQTEEGFSFPTEEVMRALREGSVGVVFLCQPNNPLGDLIPPTDMKDILDTARDRGVLVVVDEAYAEFDNPSLIQEAGGSLIVLRTFSKSFGLAGARVGYSVCDPGIAKQFSQTILPWPIAHHSVRAALAVLEQGALIAERRAVLIRQRERFVSALSELPGLRPLPSRANFVFTFVSDARKVASRLEAEGVLVAPGDTLTFDSEACTLLRAGIRMGIPAPDDHEYVLESLRRAVQ